MTDHRYATVPASGYSIVDTQTIYEGKIFRLRADRVSMPDGSEAVREIVVHPGAVAVVALDSDGRVVLIRQYRHSAHAYMWELPAGILDVDGEPAVKSAARELHEETALLADEWHTLVDLRTSPGFSNETVRVYLARGLSDVSEDDRYSGGEEEADLVIERVPLDDAVDAAMAGDIENSIAVAGLLAAARARDSGWRQLRPSDVAWPAKDGALTDR
jgi:ADP-ribose pyrophosphatase